MRIVLGLTVGMGTTMCTCIKKESQSNASGESFRMHDTEVMEMAERKEPEGTEMQAALREETDISESVDPQLCNVPVVIQPIQDYDYKNKPNEECADNDDSIQDTFVGDMVKEEHLHVEQTVQDSLLVGVIKKECNDVEESKDGCTCMVQYQ